MKHLEGGVALFVLLTFEISHIFKELHQRSSKHFLQTKLLQ